MSGKRNRGVWCGLALVFAGVAGCGNPALEFNQNLVNANKRLTDAGFKFGASVGGTLKGAAVNAAEVRKQYQELIAELEKIKAESQTWKTPSSDSAKKLSESYQNFLKVQDDGVKEFGKIVTMLEDATVAPAERAERTQVVLTEFSRREQAALAELQAFQSAYAKEHGITLTK